MKIISIYISKTKTLFKAFALDLDDTIWNGTLSEDGLQTIKENLCSDAGKPFVNFMNFVSSIAKELGIFVTICSRNDASLVKEAIEQLDEDIFPLKHQIDYIVANNNDKSSNLIKVAEQLSILPNSIIFIDDNAIIRDEVRSKIPDMLVPDWDDHQDLILQIISGGYFDRPELSMSAQNRRTQYKIIHEERKKNSLPSLKIRVREDINHVESRKLYAKSNQFKTTDRYYNYDESCKSLVFELFRETGDCLGLCSAITFRLFNNECVIINWAISCRYFEIGLEEFVLLYMREHYNFSDMYMILQKTGKNKKVEELIDKYYGSIICDDCSSVPNDSEEFVKYLPNTPTYNFLRLLNKKIGSFQLYFVSGDFEVLDKNTNLKLVNND